MIKLYTSLNYFDRDTILYDNEAFFKEMVSSKDLERDELDILWEIDKAKLININLDKIETPYGICSLHDISTGCKTAINIMYIMKNISDFGKLGAVNVTECGVNALEIIFKNIDKNNYDINLILEHEDDIWECSERDYIINGKKRIRNLLDI